VAYLDYQKYEKLFKPQKSNLSIFHDLMPFRVREVLLVASVYDAYILEREGQLFEQIYGEYYQLNLSSAPRVTSVFSIEAALQEISEGHFDLVIIMTGIERNMPIILSRKIKEIKSDLPILLLINNNNQIAHYESISKEMVHIEKMFVWNGDSNIFLAMIKYIEDSINVESDTETGGVRLILVIEDSIRYYSRYLPTLYSVIMREVQRLISGEDIDARYKILRMRARPKVLLASTYEDAVKLYEKYNEFLLCVITDVRYPKNGILTCDAGMDMVRHIKKDREVPILMQSSESENSEFAVKNDISFLDKNSKNLSRELIEFFKLNLGFGNFVFRDSEGNAIAEARYMKEFEILIEDVPAESMLYHSDRNDFSTWFMAKGEIKSALKLRDVSTNDFDDAEDIRTFLRDILRERWMEKKRDSISSFSEAVFTERSYLMRVSNGSVGGKGRGIAFTEALIQKPKFKELIKDINVTIPKTIIVGTDEFEHFVEQADFYRLIHEDRDHSEIRKDFLEMDLSSLLSQRLKKMLVNITVPLAVRSSGLFEDSLSQPFAGIYETYFLPNNHPDINVRLKQLEDAVKMVYASVFTPLAKSYFESVNHSIEEEKMAVIIQELVGSFHGDNFYPHISGVAQSYNYYPFSHMKPEDGLGLLAVGLGKSVVEGGQTYRFCPKYPKMNVMTIKDLLQNSQRYLYVLDIKNKEVDLSSGEEATLKKIPIDIAEKDGILTHCASVFDNSSYSLKPGIHTPGPRIIDFRYILQYDYIPLSETVSQILDVMGSALGTPVEIEFSVDLNKDEFGKTSFYILQVKPLIRSVDTNVVDTAKVDKSDLILYTDRGMGNGLINGIRDIVYVVPERFDKMKTREIEKEVRSLNAEMKKSGCEYILIGPGRWGSSDHFLGIPVDWASISQAKVIVEAGLKDFNVDASLGSHFFHNITSMNIGYFTVPAKSEISFIDYDYLKTFEAVTETGFLRHVRFKEPVNIIMDGRKSISLITKESWKDKDVL
jgi:hypothetical protein